MIRLCQDDFSDPAWLAKLSRSSKLTVEEFRRRFEYLAG
jgi:hypothetical protein